MRDYTFGNSVTPSKFSKWQDVITNVLEAVCLDKSGCVSSITLGSPLHEKHSWKKRFKACNEPVMRKANVICIIYRSRISCVVYISVKKMVVYVR